MRIEPWNRRGAMLLEAIVALAVVSVAGLSMLALVGAVQRDQTRTTLAEQTLVSADRIMTAMVLLTGQDLDRRLGSHGVGAFAVDVERPERSLYRIAIADTAASRSELLATVVYRPPVPK